METKHLKDIEIELCAEALATDCAARTVCDSSKLHLKHCEHCQKQVKTLSQIIRQKYKDDIAIGLNSLKPKSNSLLKWLGLSSSFILIVLIGM